MQVMNLDKSSSFSLYSVYICVHISSYNITVLIFS